jgi:hypothetical protein
MDGNKEIIDWKHFNVHWKQLINGSFEKGKTCITAFDRWDAKNTFEKSCLNQGTDKKRFPPNAEVTKVIQLGISTTKQKLAQKYGFIIGSIIGAEKNFKNVTFEISEDDAKLRAKVFMAARLVDSQFAKLRRDIRDVFKLAGLKVK